MTDLGSYKSLTLGTIGESQRYSEKKHCEEDQANEGPYITGTALHRNQRGVEESNLSPSKLRSTAAQLSHELLTSTGHVQSFRYNLLITIFSFFLSWHSSHQQLLLKHQLHQLTHPTVGEFFNVPSPASFSFIFGIEIVVMELFGNSRRRCRLKSAQVVSCCVYELSHTEKAWSSAFRKCFFFSDSLISPDLCRLLCK